MAMKTAMIVTLTFLSAIAFPAPELSGRATVINGHGGTLVHGAKVHYDADGVPSIVYTTHTPKSTAS